MHNAIVVGGSAVATIAIIVVAAIWISLTAALSGITRAPNADVFPADDIRPVTVGHDTGDAPLNILVLGTDSREGIGDPDELRSGSPTDQRSRRVLDAVAVHTDIA